MTKDESDGAHNIRPLSFFFLSLSLSLAFSFFVSPSPYKWKNVGADNGLLLILRKEIITPSLFSPASMGEMHRMGLKGKCCVGKSRRDLAEQNWEVKMKEGERTSRNVREKTRGGKEKGKRVRE